MIPRLVRYPKVDFPRFNGHGGRGRRKFRLIMSRFQDTPDIPGIDLAYRGLPAVAEQVCLFSHAFKYWCPNQSRSIVRKGLTCESRRLDMRYEEDHNFLRNLVLKIQSERIHPSRPRVNAELSERKITQMTLAVFKVFKKIHSLR